MRSRALTVTLALAALGLFVVALATDLPASKPAPAVPPALVERRFAPPPAPVVGPAAPLDEAVKGRPTVQLALLLDTSGSMEGLIDQARSELWKVVNTLSEARRDGRAVRLELALLEYGQSSLSEASGWIRVVQPFTEELDRVSEQLFALTINGGEERCGQAISTALQGLAWRTEPGALRLMLIAGNEGFDQGPVAPDEALAAAVRRGIAVNTVYCGASDDPDAAGWHEAATRGRGRFMAIDAQHPVAQVEAPQDAELARLGAALNETYLAYGAEGHAGVARQAAQDARSSGYGLANLAARSVSKASGFYKNSTWDLVEAVESKKVDLARAEEAALPAAMKGMSPAEREAFVAEQARRRAALQADIRRLGAERTKFLAEASARAAGEGATLDVAMLGAVREQAEAEGYRFE
jgi:hypothetical protein